MPQAAPASQVEAIESARSIAIDPVQSVQEPEVISDDPASEAAGKLVQKEVIRIQERRHQARLLFNEGMELQANGHYEEAIQKFTASRAIYQSL